MSAEAESLVVRKVESVRAPWFASSSSSSSGAAPASVAVLITEGLRLAEPSAHGAVIISALLAGAAVSGPESRVPAGPWVVLGGFAILAVGAIGTSQAEEGKR